MQQDMLRQRLPFIAIGVLVICVGLLLRVVYFQFLQNPRVEREFAAQRDANAGRVERFETPRGNIYDRNGNPLAVNTLQYRVGISPNVVSNRTEVAADLAVALSRDELELYNILQRDTSYEILGTVDPDVWSNLRDLDLFAMQVDRVQRRVYPQGTLAAQVIGFVAGDGEGMRGYEGVEGYYNDQLSGIIRDQEVSNIPFALPEDGSNLERGANLVLTLDRNVQFLVEAELQRAVNEYQAQGGTIIVMNPRNGDILAMASYPSFDPNRYFDVQEERELRNPAVRDIYEPGSVFKVLTVAAGLETGAITPQWTYNDQGRLDVGGISIQNWDRAAYGQVDVRQILVNSLNIGAAEIALTMGWEQFYGMMDRFGIGSPTQVDLQAEEAGLMRTPTSLSGDWSDSDLATNSFGQGLSVTPLQMLTAVNAIANDGLMMQPRIVYQMVDGDTIRTAQDTARRVISAETAEIVTQMMVSVVRDGLDSRSQVPGYTVAGKTGTAQIADAVGYVTNEFNMTFVGFLPADDPQVSILVLLERPAVGRFASQNAAPVFSRLTSRLVDLLEIPNDTIRQVLAAEGVAWQTQD